MRAGIYARISRDDDDTQLGVNRQIDDCETLAAARAWDITERYVDNDISAYKKVQRPEWERMLADIAAQRIEAVVIYHLDRLTRQPRDLERFFDICDRAGLTNMATVSGDINLATDDGRFHARILGAVARKSSDDQSRRIKRKALELAQQGKPGGGGDRPYGFENDRVTVRPDEAQVIRELAARFIAGESLRSLVADMNARGIPCVRGPWNSHTLKRVLASARVSGQRQHHGEIIGPAVWPAIIAPEQTIRIRAILADPSRRATRAPQAYLLKGLLRCWKCNTPLIARPKDDGRRRYVCGTGPNFTGCGGVYVLGDPVEAYVSDAVLARLDTPAMAAALRQTPAAGDEWQTRSDQLSGKLDELAEAYAAEVISMREWLAAREPLQRQLDDARRRVARDNTLGAIIEHIGHGKELRETWDSRPLDQRRAIIAAVLHHILVLPGRRGYNGFQRERFELVWRH